ncbi:diadenosine tetraphosphate hydrolase [Microgenomates group bacterium RIFCSPLOWO2_01_FULL_47_10]|nr:MAG: diadenosine tetraphosphate hydrolase [Microgenomates group bacterium RIFCSPLOWO2_01_FULL_47_10]
MSLDCIFCQIVSGSIPAHKIYEDENHLAFLTIFPNTDGSTVVIPKTHCDSYAFNNSDKVLTDLILATKKVAKMLDRAFEDVGRTGMIFEGYGVDHLHAKLFPMHGTGQMETWKKMESEKKRDEFYTMYPGYLSSHDSHRADEASLAALAVKIINKNK